MLKPRCHIGQKVVVAKSEHLRQGVNHGVEVMFAKIPPLGDKLGVVLDGGKNVGGQRWKAVNVSS